MNPARRKLLTATCSLLGYSSVLNTMLNLKLAEAAAVDQSTTNDYKALVCMFLFGGNDSYNMLIPAESEEHKLYTASRGNLALPINGNPENAALLLPGYSQDKRRFAVHPAMPEIRDLYAERQLAFLANTGTLVEPTTVRSYKNRSAKVPTALFSHNDQRDQWQTGLSHTKLHTGWLGRTTELLASANTNQIPDAISLNGNNLMQTSHRRGPFTITQQGSVEMVSDLAAPIFELFSDATGSKKNSLFLKEFLDSSRRSIENNERFAKAFKEIALPNHTAAKSKLAESLDAVAKSIIVGQKNGLKRQTFFVLVPGWDNHHDLLEKHHLLLRDISHSIGRFQSTIGSVGLANAVTTFTASEFSRTLRSNGRGTDHAWGGNQIITGGAVKGGTIYGQYPSELLLNDGLDVGKNGRLLPTTSCDQYFANLLQWFGVPKRAMVDVLPNLHNFPPELPGFL